MQFKKNCSSSPVQQESEYMSVNVAIVMTCAAGIRKLPRVDVRPSVRTVQPPIERVQGVYSGRG